MAVENTRYTESGELSRLLPHLRHIHLIGICGAGMRVLAEHLVLCGYTVTGSDEATKGEGALSLSLAGIPVVLPSADSGIIDADLAVYSLAIPNTHPELLLAQQKGIPTVSRADLLASLMLAYPERIGIAGTHGKSTVTAMTAAILAAAGRMPTVAAGASLTPRGSGYRAGGRDLFLFEACEYRDSFLSFHPTVAVLTNAEWDHPDYFPAWEDCLRSFRAYLTRPSVRIAVLSGDDAGARKVAEGLSVPYITFGLSPSSDLFAEEIREGAGGTAFSLFLQGKPLGNVRWKVPGRHNVLNALAAAGAALAVGASHEAIVEGLSAFSGIPRRTEYRGTLAGVTYYDDYAHHPTEIRAALTALRGGGGRLICLYQPHTFSRTAGLFAEFSSALSLADLPILVDTYAAREVNVSGVSVAALAAAVGGIAFPTPEAAVLFVLSEARPGDRVVVMGAGDIAERVFCGALSFTGD